MRIVAPRWQQDSQKSVKIRLSYKRTEKTETGEAMDAVNSYFRQRYDHQFIYDWPLLERQLRGAGFEQIARVSFQQAVNSKSVVLDD